MSKFTSALLVLLAVVLIPARSYCLQDIAVKSISGKVISINVEGGIVKIHTEIGDMTFYMTAISDFSRDNHHMSAIEIQKDDLIVVKYVRDEGKNNIVSLEDREKSP